MMMVVTSGCQMLMYDSTQRGLFPGDVQATAGYGGLHNAYQSYYWFCEDYPNAHHVFIVCDAADDGPDGCQDVALDMEKYDAGAQDAVVWVRRQFSRGVARPILYASLAVMAVVLANLARAGISLSSVRIWTSHPTGRRHICNGACGYAMPDSGIAATQYSWSPGAVNIDISALASDFFATPRPAPTAPEGAILVTCVVNSDGRLEWTAFNPQTGEVFHTWQTTPGGGLVGAQKNVRNCEWFSMGVPWG
jgi:hypothetical protein